MKKALSILAILLLVAVVFPVTAFARGYGGGKGGRVSITRGYVVCTVEDCNREDTHWHGDSRYAGHYAGDGHGWHAGYADNGYLSGNGERPIEQPAGLDEENDYWSGDGYGCYGGGYGCYGGCGGGYGGGRRGGGYR